MTKPELGSNIKEKIIKQKMQIICICKGINLGKILDCIQPGDSVADVGRKCGSGSGGCKGERCSKKINILIKKKEELLKSRMVDDPSTGF